MHGLQAGRIGVQFRRRRGPGRHIVVPVDLFFDSRLDVRLLAEGRDDDKNKKQTSEASGHTHLLKAAGYERDCTPDFVEQEADWRYPTDQQTDPEPITERPDASVIEIEVHRSFDSVGSARSALPTTLKMTIW